LIKGSEVDAGKVYAADIDLGVKNNSHTLMFEFIREAFSGKRARILEVGCATGFFGRFLKEHGHEVWGIEMSPQQAEIASRRLDYVYTGKVEDFLCAEVAEGKTFDFIVFGDVLEHLVDPLGVLERSGEILSPGGGIVASIPNVAHLAVRAMLLEGRWEYSTFGILDESHLRFFTRRSIVRLFSNAGLRVQRMYTVRVPLINAGIIVDQEMAEKAKKALRDEDDDVYQFVVMALRVEDSIDYEENKDFIVSNPMHVLCLPPIENWSVGDIRLRNPLEKWRQVYGGIVMTKNVSSYMQEDLSWADVVIIQREANAFTLRLISQLQKLKKPVILDIDDLLTDVPPFLASSAHLARNRGKLEKALRMADAITVTTKRLQDRLIKYNEHTYIVPNCASSDYRRVVHYETEEPHVTLIVASSDTVRVDFIVSALLRLQAGPEFNLNIVGIGPPGRYLSARGIDLKCYENMDYGSFKKFIASLDNSIGIIPLDHSEFSSCKSAIKYADYSLAGIPVICSKVSPYKDIIEDGKSGVLVENEESAWFEALREMGISVEKRKRIADCAYDLCKRDFSMAKAAEAWNRVFVTVRSGDGERISEEELNTWLRRKRMELILRALVTPHFYVLVARHFFREGALFLKRLADIRGWLD
jgi:O-antigen biosynthesis protein